MPDITRHTRSLSLALIVFVGALANFETQASATATLPTAKPQAQRNDTTVRNIAAPTNPPTGTLVPEVTIGVASGAEEYMFSSIGGVAVANDGRMFILDRGAGTSSATRTGAIVRLYDANGRFIRNVGRQGQGPGEYQTPLGIDRLPDGRVIVLDPGSNSINVYAANGDAITKWDAGDRARDFTPNRLLVDTAGFTHLRMSTIRPNATGAVTRETMWQRFDPTGKILDTLFAPPAPTLQRATISSGERQMAVPFQPVFQSVMTRLGHFVTLRTDRYAIDLLRPTVTGGVSSHWRPGSPVTSLRRAVSGAAFAPGEREAWESAIERVMRRITADWIWNGPRVAREKPPLAGVAVAQDGRLWVKLAGPGIPAPRENPADSMDVDDNIPFRDPDIYDVVETDGRYVGRVRFAQQTSLVAMMRDQIWAVTADADGVQKLTRFRISWSR